MKKISIIALFLSACQLGVQGPDVQCDPNEREFYDKFHVKYCVPIKLDANIIDASNEMNEYILETFKTHWNETPIKNCMSVVVVKVVEGYMFSCNLNGKELKCFGTAREDGFLTVARAKTWLDSAYIHEIVHWLQICAGKTEMNHEDISVWLEVERWEYSHR